jgi:hypothetical protein
MTYINKTQPIVTSPGKYLKENFKGKEKLQNEAQVLIDLYTKATKSECVMWDKIFGFGEYHYNDSKGGEHSYLAAGFAISSTGLTLYNMIGWDNYKKQIEKLGKYKISGKSCLSIKSIEDIDLKILKDVIGLSLQDMKEKYKNHLRQ